jgi:hypothetical protein
MSAILLEKSRTAVDAVSFASVAIWQLPEPVLGSAHCFKYSLAYVVEEECVLRYDNERGKGDHRHWHDQEFAYEFSTVECLLRDFYTDIDKWRESR